MSEEKEFYSIGRGSLNLNGKFYYGLDYAITDFMRSLEHENKELKNQLENKYSKIGTFTNEVLYEENTKLINQQKEFIEYLRNLSNWYSADGVKQGMVNEILNKYKEINHIVDVEQMVGGKE